MKYILAIDQSTQGTKAIIFEQSGKLVARCDKPHRQLTASGYISHDLNEIFENLLWLVPKVIEKSGIDESDLSAVAITNQRETACAWDSDGAPLAHAVVWQCGRAQPIAEGLQDYAGEIKKISGLPLSPYFSAAKFRWLLDNISAKNMADIHLGTVDSYLLYRLTGEFKTDITNASRTQLMDMRTGDWSNRLTDIFGIDRAFLPKICGCDDNFGDTDFCGLLKQRVPILAVMGDSHAALFGHGCGKIGEGKVTFGTGSSVMINTADSIAEHDNLNSTVAFSQGGRIHYALEGNINHTGSLVSWLVELGMFCSAADLEKWASEANLNDNTVLVPAFGGLGSPYNNPCAQAVMWGMSKSTTKSEIARAAQEAVVFQVKDLVCELDCCLGQKLKSLKADGGASKSAALMQMQADILQRQIVTDEIEELSAYGAAKMAAQSARLAFDKPAAGYKIQPKSNGILNQKYKLWQKTISEMTNRKQEP